MTVYETKKNRADEQGLVSTLSKMGIFLGSLGAFSPCDFIAYRPDKPPLLVEFKRRSHTFGYYPTVMIPEKKLRRCLSISEDMGIGFMYIVEFNDGLYCCMVDDYTTGHGGRTDRSDPNDVGRMAFIDIKNFRRM